MRKYSRLVFIRDCNPIYEDYTSKYSTLRFYCKLISILAEKLEIPTIDILYFKECHASDKKDLVSLQRDMFDWYNSTSDTDLSTIRLRDDLKSRNIGLNFINFSDYDYDNIDDFDSSLIILSFMTDKRGCIHRTLGKILDLIKRSYCFIYLSSDNEFSNCSYKWDDSRLCCLEAIDEFYSKDKSLMQKFKAIIMTESNSENIVGNLQDRFNAPVFYLPMIVDERDIRFANWNFDKMEDKIVMLKTLKYFTEDKYPRFLESIRDHAVVYESSFPVNRRVFRPVCDKFGFEYRFARFWKMPILESQKLKPYKFYLGMSNSGSSRFTTKIIEGTNAGCYTLTPKIDLVSAGFDAKDYPICVKTLSSSGVGEILTPDAYPIEDCDLSLEKACDIMFESSETDFDNRLKRQMKFILDYFLPDSDCVKECLNFIVKYLSLI